MTRHDPKHLSAEDRILWNRVARTATPLRGKALEPEPQALDKALFEAEMERIAPARPEMRASRTTHPERKIQGTQPLDRPTRNRLSRGRLPIDARVDLHGMTQAQAHALLLSFLHRAREAGLRHVLVITGKGASARSDGVLRRAVPGWFATQPFRALVGGHDNAARQHGGEGALYVRLRRDRGPGT